MNAEPEPLSGQLAADVEEAVRDAAFELAAARSVGFEEDEFGELIARGVMATFYAVGSDWEVDLRLADGSTVSFDVPQRAVHFGPAPAPGGGTRG